MVSVKLFILCVCYFVIEARCGKVPITPCSKSDNTCILSSANAVLPYFIEGIEEYGIPPIEPLFLKKVIADSGELKLKFEDLTVVGLKDAKLTKIERDDTKLKLVIETPFKVTGTYTASGNLALLKVEGHGPMELQTDKARLFVDIKMKTFERDGNTYYKVDKYKTKFEVIDEFFFKFDNLFNGDKTLAEPVIMFLKQNWRDLFPELGKPVIKKVVAIKVPDVEKVFAYIPIHELELP